MLHSEVMLQLNPGASTILQLFPKSEAEDAEITQYCKRLLPHAQPQKATQSSVTNQCRALANWLLIDC